jgi:hypothetical protein
MNRHEVRPAALLYTHLVSNFVEIFSLVSDIMNAKGRSYIQNRPRRYVSLYAQHVKSMGLDVLFIIANIHVEIDPQGHSTDHYFSVGRKCVLRKLHLTLVKGLFWK